MSAGDTKSEIAASRAIYFRDLDQGKSSTNSTSDSRAKRPSYVGISTALNGYSPYASYRTDSGRRISPPLHLPSQRQPHLNSVDLVLNQDGFQRSLAEFQETMRDITMGRPESSDITDNARILHVQDQFFPTSHMKEVIKDGEGKSVTTITQFHSGRNGAGSPGSNGTGSPGTPNGTQKKNLVSKQIERLYGGDPFAQIRLTSPEHQVRTNHQDDILRSDPGFNGNNGTNGTAPGGKGSPERSFGSGAGGFFAKRFGITKMKDHSTLKSQEHMPGEITPLKVPAVFKLLRPEFREQLKQSSCRVSMPDEEGKERVIPIQRESYSAPAAGRQSPQRLDTTATPTSRPATERIIPITRLNGNSPNGVNGVNLPPSRLLNGSSALAGVKPLNGNAAPVAANGNGMYNGRQSPLVNGSGLNNSSQPIVNGVTRRTVPNVIGFRNTIQSPPPAAKSSNEATVTVPAKPLIIRKLSPLSPKHILVAPSNGNHTAVKPAPAPKPEHLMSPPLSPVPSDGARSGSPADSCRTGSTMSPCPPLSTQDNFEDSGVDESSGPAPASDNLPTGITKLSLEDARIEDNPDEVTNDQTVEVANDQKVTMNGSSEDQVTSFMNGVNQDHKDQDHNQDQDHKEVESVEHRYPEDYMEYNGEEEEMMDRDQYAPQYYGLRERELLCPILEEDNESTASGSLLNLQQASGSLQSLQQSPNIQQASGTASEAAGNNTAEATTNGASTSGYSSDDPLLVTELQDGHYYIKVLENEIFKFEEQICDFDEELVISTDIPEESREKILSTVGLAKLLMAQKLMQFRGLCDKNINVTVEEDPFVPTPGDLAGFWDMVHIQIDQVHNRFADLQQLRSQGWKETKVEVKAVSKKPMNKNKNVNKPIKPKEKSEAAKARDEARKKMLEAKKKMMKLNKENKENSDLIIMM